MASRRSAANLERLRKLRQAHGLGEYSGTKRSSRPGRKSGKQTGKRNVGRPRRKARKVAGRPFKSTNQTRGLNPYAFA